MKLNELSASNQSLSQNGIALKAGPIAFKIRSNQDAVIRQIRQLYGNFDVLEADEFVDFEVTIDSSTSWFRKYVYRQANFLLDKFQPFKPLPYNQGFAMLEWGMNWCIAAHCHQYLIIHAAVISKNGVTVMLPAPAGSGKSTLTALLAYSGWRLLSDELALIRLEDLKIDALARPINLKNHSIEVIQSTFPHITHSDVIKDTHKGTVCLFEPPKESVDQVQQPQTLTHVIFPRFAKGQTLQFSPIEKDALFFDLIENSFNYNVLGELGFDCITQLLPTVEAMHFTYSDNDQAIQAFERLCHEG